MGEIIGWAVLLDIGAALSVGPIFAAIVREAATRGFGASMRVVIGSATADLLLLVPAMAFAWLVAAVAAVHVILGAVGAIALVVFAARAVRDSRVLWRGGAPVPTGRWAFITGIVSNLTNPLSWTFWLATGTPAMAHAHSVGGWTGLVLFTLTWFAVACGIEAVVACLIAVSGRRVGARGRRCSPGRPRHCSS
ncbi:MAG: LysE family transporter, partial [Kutzneria sp.]|nr:LysE family transporter [Kutzneria sp.]